MASRLKEDERNERTIRNLLKLPENRRCINCNSLGPQYVCTNFWTFVCTNCSGMHREFTHRVKSISMAKFTSQEVSALQGGGNASAKEIYLKEFDPQRHTLPDGSNVDRLREFIKHVYVDRRYSGDRSSDKPPRGKMGETEDINDQRRRSETYQGGSRSPPYEERYERRYSDGTSPGGRSPGYNQENRQQSDIKKSPARTEVINDWRREDRFGNGRKSDDGRISDRCPKPEVRSPDRQRDSDVSSPPVVRPVRDILGENVTPLRVIEPPKANNGRSSAGSLHTQRTASSSSLASSNSNPAELKTETTLIDFDAVPEPPVTVSVPQTQQSVNNQTTSSVADNWANFDVMAEVQLSQPPSNANPLQSVLSELSVPASVPAMGGISGSGASTSSSVSIASAIPSSNSAGASLFSAFSSVSAAPAVSQFTAIPHGGAPGTATSTVMPPLSVDGGFMNAANLGHWGNMQRTQQYSTSNLTGGLNPPQPFAPTSSQTVSNQPWNVLVNPNSQGPAHAPAAQVSTQSVTTPSVKISPEAGGRKELPEDLFAMSFPGWQSGPRPPHGIGFNMQYNMQMPMSTYPQPSKSANPFDVGNEQPPVPTPTFPSMASLQGALPYMASPTTLLTSSLDAPSSTWIAQQPSQPPSMPLQAPSSYTPAVLPGPYMGQQVPTNMQFRPHATAGLRLEGSAFGTINPPQQLGGLYAAPPTQNTFSSVGGNPFG